jgi:hypothetical protein
MVGISTQRGAALMIMVMIVGVAVTAWMLSLYGAGLTNTRTTSDREHNARVLTLAKQALIGYVLQQASSENYPGRLPCPEPDGNISSNPGVSTGTCSLPAVGRLPWKTLGIDQLLDAAGEPLWYVVSPGWSYSGTTLTLNSNTAGQLMLDNLPGGHAAFIIAPGPATTVSTSANCVARVQTRAAPASGMNFRDYLECQNAVASATTYATSGPSGSFNDQILGVTGRDVWSVVEAAVAERFQREVAPSLVTLLSAPYSDANQWGNGVLPTTSRPILPFATSFAGGTSPNQGGLPLTRSQGCTAGTDPLCDPDFVRWDTSSTPTFTSIGGGTATYQGSDCTASTSTEVRCTVNYSGTCNSLLGNLLGFTCTRDNLTLNGRLQANAINVGRTLRQFTSAGIVGFASLSSNQTPLNSSGTAMADIRGGVNGTSFDTGTPLPSVSCTSFFIFGLFFPCTAHGSVTITVPITVFADAPNLPTFFSNANHQWFLNNRWYEVFYYAVAPSQSPEGASFAAGTRFDCKVAGDCLTVNGGSAPATGVRAVAALMGQSLNGVARPNSNLVDYLDSTENQDGNTTFEQRVASRTFNDRFFAINAY